MPYFAEHLKCKDQIIPKQTNLPTKDDKKKLVNTQFSSPNNKDAIQIPIRVTVIKFIIPVTLCDIETNEEMCQS